MFHLSPMIYQVGPIKLPSLTTLQNADLEARLCAHGSLSSEEIISTNKLARQAQEDQLTIDWAICTLQIKRRQLDEYLLQCQALCAPIRKLPNELLSKIFSHCATFTSFSNSITQMEASNCQAGFIIELVCSRWHAVVASTPQLWNYFNLDIDLGMKKEFPPSPTFLVQLNNFANLIRVYLQRSQDTLIDVKISTRLEDILGSPAISLLFSYSHRWRSFKFVNNTCFGINKDSFAPLTGNLPHLTHLEIKVTNEAAVKPNLVPFASAPNLQHCDAAGDYSSLHSLASVAKSLSASMPNIGTRFLEDASAYSQMQQLSLEILDDHAPLAPQETPIVRSSLRTLNLATSKDIVGDDFIGVADNLLNNLRTPNITHLGLRLRTAQGACSLLNIKQFIFQSGAALTSLQLEHIDMTDTGLLEILGVLPSLQKLIVDDFCSFYGKCSPPRILTDNLLKTLQSSPKMIIPRLTHLELSLFADQVGDEDIAQMVARRAEYGLKSFSLHIQSYTGMRKVDVKAFNGWKRLSHLGFHEEISSGRPKEMQLCSCASTA